jgi:hypothetical protein
MITLTLDKLNSLSGHNRSVRCGLQGRACLLVLGKDGLDRTDVDDFSVDEQRSLIAYLSDLILDM